MAMASANGWSPLAFFRVDWASDLKIRMLASGEARRGLLDDDGACGWIGFRSQALVRQCCAAQPCGAS
jgi:hypothetical protein